MIVLLLVVLSVLVAGSVAWLLRSEGGSNASAWLVAVAASRLPAHRQDWGRAMVAELAGIRGGARRWQFAAGVLRVALVLQPRPRALMLLAAAGGLAVTAAGTAAAAIRVPDLSVFAAVLGLLLTGCTILTLPRGQRKPRPPRPALVAGAAAAIGMAASVTAVTRIAVAYPSAAVDRTHAFSVLFAVTVVGYLALAPALARRGGRPALVLWWGLAGALASGAVWAVAALAWPVGTDGIAAWLWPVGAAATFAASAGGAAACRSRRAGLRAGMLATILGAPLHLVTELTALLAIGHYTLTDSYDIAAYPHSGFPNVASYVLSDAVAGNILAGLVLYPLSWLFLAALGAVAGADLGAFTARQAAHKP